MNHNKADKFASDEQRCGEDTHDQVAEDGMQRIYTEARQVEASPSMYKPHTMGVANQTEAQARTTNLTAELLQSKS